MDLVSKYACGRWRWTRLFHRHLSPRRCQDQSTGGKGRRRLRWNTRYFSLDWRIGRSSLISASQGTTKEILLRDGVKGLYRGLGPTITGYLPTWAIYFSLYDGIKTRFGNAHWKRRVSHGDENGM